MDLVYRYRVSLSSAVATYSGPVPKLWVGTIAEHRRTVRDAIIDATATLATEHGIASLTMSGIAETTGVGRATLYKYFSDVDSILAAWHEQHVERYLARLVAVRARASDTWERLVNVLEAYASFAHDRSADHDASHHAAPRHPHDASHHAAHGSHGATDVGALVHRTDHATDVQQRLSKFVEELIRAAARTDAVRRDVPSGELAQYCLHALGPANATRSHEATRRLVNVTLAGLRPASARRRRAVRP